MKPTTLPLLVSPTTHQPLQLVQEQSPYGESLEVLVCAQSGERFPIRDGIPDFLNSADLSGSNRKYQTLYDRLAPFYDLFENWYYRLARGGDVRARHEYLSELSVRPGDKVLEVSVGTGANLRQLPRAAEYYGLDISWGMLRQSQKNSRRWKLPVELFCGAAERLPFADASFDVVFHVGGINFFNDKARAIAELIRVAKPGTKLMIADETEQVARKLAKAPIAGPFYDGRSETITTPVDLVPAGMRDIHVRTLARGLLYCLSFRKP